MTFGLLSLCKLFSRSVDLGRRVLGRLGNPRVCGLDATCRQAAMGKILGRQESLGLGVRIPDKMQRRCALQAMAV